MDPILYAEYQQFENRHWWFVGVREIIFNFLKTALKPKEADITRRKNPRILDAGCGTGQFLPGLSKMGKVVGADFSRSALRILKGKGFRNVIQADIQSLPFPPGQFDLVCAISLLEHMENDALTLQELTRVARPGGFLAVTVPAYPFLWGDQDRLGHHYRRYTVSGLQDLLAGAGLTAVRFTFFGTAVFPIGLAVRKLRSGLARLFPGLRSVSDFSYSAPPGLNQLFLLIMRLEKRWLRRFQFPFGLMIFILAEKR